MRREQASALALALLLLTACTGGGDDTSPPSAASGAQEQEQEQQEAAPQDAEELAEAQAVASVTFPVAYLEGAEITLDVLGFERAGELVRMRLRASAELPPGEDEVNVGAAQVGEEVFGGRPVEAELIDPVGLKAYTSFVARSQQDVLVLRDGEPRLVVLYFATPEGDVETVDVNLGPYAELLTDVPFDLS